MGISKGSISLCRYRLIGAKLASPKQVEKYLQKFKSPPIKLDGPPKELKVGWVLPKGLFPEEERYGDHWDLSDCLINDGYLLKLRMERRKVPSELVQLLYNQISTHDHHDKKKMKSKKKAKEMREELQETLLKQSLPVITYLEAHWKHDGNVTLFTTSKKSKEIFEEMFIKTFAKPLKALLVPISPPLMGMSAHNWGKIAPTQKFIKRLEPVLPSTQELSETFN